MFENYEEDNLLNLKFLQKKQKFFLRQTKFFEQLKLIKPKFFLDFLKLSRDKRILKYNAKNKINDYKKFCDAQNIHLLNVEDKDTYTFQGSNLKRVQTFQKNILKISVNKIILIFSKMNMQRLIKNF